MKYTKNRTQKIFLYIVLGFLMSNVGIIYASSDDMAISSQVEWGLRAYGTKISFAQTIYCTRFSYDSFNNVWWYWYNIKTSGSPFSVVGLSVQNGNVTVNHLGDLQIKLTVSAPSGTVSTTKIYCGNLGKPQIVEGADSWSYNSVTNILTLTVTHHSPETIIITWATVTVSPMVKAMLGLVPLLAALLLFMPYIKGERKIENLDDMIKEILPIIITLIILLSMVAWVWTLW